MADVAPAASQIEINDAIFCQHFKEVVSNIYQPQGKSALSLYERSLIYIFLKCGECSADFREENDTFFGVSCVPLSITSVSHMTHVGLVRSYQP